MERIPLHIITLYQPEVWLNVTITELSSFPLLKRNRNKLEKINIEEAKKSGIQITLLRHNGRTVSNKGKKYYHLRETWIYTDKLVSCLEDFDVRLIHTEEEATHPSYKFEFRPDFAETPDSLDKVYVDKLINKIRNQNKVCVRQLWSNPVAGRFGTLPLEVSEEIAKETANLMLGPINDRCIRKGDLDFKKINGVWWLLFSK